MKNAAAAFLVLAAASSALAQDVDNDDIPTQCVTVCSNIATVSDDCDRAFDRDADELACMCQARNAEQVVPICAACIAFYDSDRDDDRDDQDNDAGDLRRSCSFSSTSYDPSTTYSVAAMTAATSLTSSASGATTTNAASSAINSASSRLSELSSSATSATGAAGSSISSAISSASSAAAQPSATGNVAAVNAGGPAALAGAALLAAAAWL